MIVIADGGSTGTTWCTIGKNMTSEICRTGGINPFFLAAGDISRLLETEFTLPRNGVSSVFFYGAGCNLPDKKQMLSGVLSSFFDTGNVEVNGDLLAATRSLCGEKPGIACILGTGSNSCLYDGREIVQNVPPLGFILGDEGSGAYLGKRLLGDIFKNRISEPVRDTFFAAYPDTTLGNVLESVYRNPFPNRFLAQYAEFVAANIHYPEIRNLADNGFREFFERNVMQYPDVRQLPVHFTGSVAYFFADRLECMARSFELNIGIISREPIDGLIEYHVAKLAGGFD